MQEQTHHELLGVTPASSESEIRAAYKALALVWHPDRNRAPEAAATFEKIRFAYNRLVGNAQYGTIELKGHDWIGRDVWRFWPDEDEWQRATVTDWDAETGEHLLVYNQGGDEEEEEDFNLDKASGAQMQLPEHRKRNLFLEFGGSTFGQQKAETVCEGLWGNTYDWDDLAQRKKDSIERALQFMQLQLEDDAALWEMGEQAVMMFYDVSQVCSDPEIAARAAAIACETLERYEEHVLSWELPLERTKMVQVLAMLRYQGVGWDSTAVAEFADEAYSYFDSTAELIGAKPGRLSVRSSDEWYFIIIDLFLLHAADLVYPDRYPRDWGLELALPALWEHLRNNPMVNTPAPGAYSSTFQNSYYLATHLACVLTGWGTVIDESNEVDCPWLYRYIGESLAWWLDQAKRQTEGKQAHVDLDAVAEGIDALKGLELTECSAPAVCQATVWLLDAQNPDGSWPARWHPEDAKCFYGAIYDALHPAWVAAYALCDRRPDPAGAAGWGRFMRPLMDKACFHIDPKSTFVNPNTQFMIGFR